MCSMNCYECKNLIETVRAIKVVNKITDTSTLTCGISGRYVNPVEGYDCNDLCIGEHKVNRIESIYDKVVMENRVTNR